MSALAGQADSLMFCLTKCFSAPYGAMIVGNKAFIDEARTVRWMLGGGMKQGGVMAAAGITALKTMRWKIKEDHKESFYKDWISTK